MVKLIALYTQPEDKESFNDKYYNEHIPLTKKVPGIERVEISEMYGTPGGESKYYLMAELYFKDKEALDTAMRSPEMRAAGKNLMSFAGPLVSMMFGEVLDR